jgi:hypothetical protein
LALPTKIIVVCNGLPGTKTLAYTEKP